MSKLAQGASPGKMEKKRAAPEARQIETSPLNLLSQEECVAPPGLGSYPIVSPRLTPWANLLTRRWR